LAGSLGAGVLVDGAAVSGVLAFLGGTVGAATGAAASGLAGAAGALGAGAAASGVLAFFGGVIIAGAGAAA
jgi:hypothetical protein